MKLSIIIPCYNSERTIGNCIKSILKSNYSNYELIVVDDGSTDNTPKIVKRLKRKLISQKKNQGTCTARNIGAKKASGEILVFIDSDVLIQKDTLTKINSRFKKQTDLSAIVGIYSKDHPYSSQASRFKNLHMRYTYFIMPDYIPILNTSLTAIKKSVFMEVGGFDKKIKFSSDDWDLGRRISEQNHKIFLDKDLEVIHDKNYSLSQLLKTDFVKARSVIKYILRNYSQTSLHSKRCGSIPLNFFLSSPVCVLFILGILAFLVFPSLILGLLLLITIEVYILINFKFLHYFYKLSGLKFVLDSGIILFLNVLAMSLGGFFGLIDFFILNKRF